MTRSKKNIIELKDWKAGEQSKTIYCSPNFVRKSVFVKDWAENVQLSITDLE
jgi:hypothetical protein